MKTFMGSLALLVAAGLSTQADAGVLKDSKSGIVYQTMALGKVVDEKVGVKLGIETKNGVGPAMWVRFYEGTAAHLMAGAVLSMDLSKCSSIKGTANLDCTKKVEVDSVPFYTPAVSPTKVSRHFL
jgi:hypothetical protein